MGLAGAHRLFALLDEQPETDEGYVTLVNAREKEDGTIEECSERTGVWAWKHPHHDGTLTYPRLMGDVRFFDVNFGYTPEKDGSAQHLPLRQTRPEAGLRRLHRRGQDHHHQPHQPLLRHQRWQESATTASTSTRSRRPICATRWASCCRTPTSSPHGDGETYATASWTPRTTSASPPPNSPARTTFIRRLPEGYDTKLQGNGANLSQGQRQLLAIARAAVADRR